MHTKLKYTLVKMNMSTEERYQLAFKSKLEENDNSIIFYLSFCPRDCLMTLKLNATSSEFHPVVCFGNNPHSKYQLHTVHHSKWPSQHL